MGITNEQKELLNKFMGYVAFKVGLGDLIKNAESQVAGDLALADGKMYLGAATGKAAEKTMSGDVTITREGVTTIGATKVAKSMLAAVLQPSHVVKYAGTFQTAGGDAAETISVPGVLNTDVVVVFVKTLGTGSRSVVAAAANTDQIDVTMSGDPTTDHYLYYLVLRAA
jgi:hypothetical protein